MPADLRQCVDSMHQQASSAKHGGAMSDQQYRDCVMQLEQLADKAMEACRNAGSGLDAKVQDAVKRAHAEMSKAKHDMMSHA